MPTTKTSPEATGLGKLYEWLWRDILKLTKPITYHCRAFYHGNPLIVMLAWVFTALGLSGHLDWALAVGIFGGVIMGHFWWGEQYCKEHGGPRRLLKAVGNKIRNG
jgi:hypothetical protein